MDIQIANFFVLLLTLALPVLVSFFVIYWAVRLAIRHERGPRD